MNLQILTPKGKEFEEKIEELTLPTMIGEITVLPGHTPLISVLKAGRIKIKTKEKEISLETEGGIAEISPKEIFLLLKQFLALTEI